MSPKEKVQNEVETQDIYSRTILKYKSEALFQFCEIFYFSSATFQKEILDFALRKIYLTDVVYTYCILLLMVVYFHQVPSQLEMQDFYFIIFAIMVMLLLK